MTSSDRSLGLEGAVAVVTGGRSGIGEATVRHLESQGATVHALDLQGEPSADVTDRASLDAIAGGLDRLDVLVNAAGILTPNRSFEDVPAADFEKTFAVNVLGIVNACQAFGALLRANGGGAIVNVASQSSFVSLPEQSAYVASKAAVAGLTRSIAIDWARQGVRANAVAPTFTETPMNAGFFEDGKKREGVSGRIPLGRPLEAHEIATAIGFLASPRSSGMTGAVVPVDGGWIAGEATLPW